MKDINTLGRKLTAAEIKEVLKKEYAKNDHDTNDNFLTRFAKAIEEYAEQEQQSNIKSACTIYTDVLNNAKFSEIDMWKCWEAAKHFFTGPNQPLNFVEWLKENTIEQPEQREPDGWMFDNEVYTSYKAAKDAAIDFGADLEDVYAFYRSPPSIKEDVLVTALKAIMNCCEEKTTFQANIWSIANEAIKGKTDAREVSDEPDVHNDLNKILETLKRMEDNYNLKSKEFDIKIYIELDYLSKIKQE